MADDIGGIGLANIGKEALLQAKMSSQISKLPKDGKANSPVDLEEATKAAQQFESLLVKQMMDSMWKTVHSTGILSGSKEEEQYRDMFSEALSDEISKGEGIGVRNVLLKELAKQRTYETGGTEISAPSKPLKTS